MLVMLQQLAGCQISSDQCCTCSPEICLLIVQDLESPDLIKQEARGQDVCGDALQVLGHLMGKPNRSLVSVLIFLIFYLILAFFAVFVEPRANLQEARSQDGCGNAFQGSGHQRHTVYDPDPS